MEMTFIKPLGYDPQKCGRMMAERKLDGIVLTSNENVFYTTGLPVTRGQVNPILFALWNQYPSYSVVHADGMPTMICWAGALGGHEFWVKDIRSAWVRGATNEELSDCLKASFKPKARVGIESSAPYSVVKMLQQQVPGAELVLVDDIFDELRSVKSEEELAMMAKSLEITEKAVEKLQGEITRETTGHQLISRAKALLFELGASGVDHTTMAIGRNNPEIPEDVRSKEGDLVILDLGAILHGYASDNRRLAIMGEPPKSLAEAHDDMVEIVVATGKSARPGMGFGEICKAAEGRYAERKRDPMFISVGHTIGLQTEELWISRDSTRKFEKGMVFNVELYTQAETGVYIGTEDTFVVEGNGSRQLSRLPHDIRVVR
jgi:Xaa-Pro aminopeptidase